MCLCAYVRACVCDLLMLDSLFFARLTENLYFLCSRELPHSILRQNLASCGFYMEIHQDVTSCCKGLPLFLSQNSQSAQHQEAQSTLNLDWSHQGQQFSYNAQRVGFLFLPLSLSTPCSSNLPLAPAAHRLYASGEGHPPLVECFSGPGVRFLFLIHAFM